MLKREVKKDKEAYGIYRAENLRPVAGDLLWVSTNSPYLRPDFFD